MKQSKRASERRTEYLLAELLTAQGWSLKTPPKGHLLIQQEYKNLPELYEIFKTASKSGSGAGLPEAILVDPKDPAPLAVIEAKASSSSIDDARIEAQHYADFCIALGFPVLAIGIAGTSEEDFELRVAKWNSRRWEPITYDGRPIGWIPNLADLRKVASAHVSSEIRPTPPQPEVLAEKADEINRLLRESRIKDEFRPAVVGAIMLAVWSSKGNLRKDKKNILADINRACEQAFGEAGKPDLASSLRIDEANEKLASNARRILFILERLNVPVLTAEHDYLGQLYETFFRYTGGNTIGQYFTPRHIAEFMVELCEVGPQDTVLDPACGTGGFLISSMHKMLDMGRVSREQMVQIVRDHLIGFEEVPITAALCVANMILRGDGSTGVHRADCFTTEKFPLNQATVVLMNPPFPHRRTDTPPEDFIVRGLEGLSHRGRLAVIAPMALLGDRKKASWRRKILEKNTLEAVVELPVELFAPYASSTTAIIVLQKGKPHNGRPALFAHIKNDGFRLHRKTRVQHVGSQLPAIIRAFREGVEHPGLCGMASVTGEDEWAPGAMIPANSLDQAEILREVEKLVRIKTSVTIRFAPQFHQLRHSEHREMAAPFGDYWTRKAKALPATDEVISKYFDLYYGQKELESKLGLGQGCLPIISSQGSQNGIYGFFDFDWPIEPPIVTVPRTGSIGEAHVQEWPCGASSDNIILVPREGVLLPLLYIAAATIRMERWRFNYGRKITPDRIANFPLTTDEDLIDTISASLRRSNELEKQALEHLASGN